MLLRRVIDQVKAQNWTAVALDFLIVVLGVFIGIQVSNWNADRHDRKLETVYLERLHADVLAAIEDKKSSLNWNLVRYREREAFLGMLRAGALEEADRETAANALFFAGRMNPLRWRWGTVRELYATGRITLLRDTKLRDALAAAESSHDRMREIVSSNQAMSMSILDLISNKYQTVSLDPVKVEFDFNELAADGEFIATALGVDPLAVEPSTDSNTSNDG